MTLLNQAKATRILNAVAGSAILAGLSITTVQAQDYRGTQAGYYAHEACKAHESKDKLIGGGIGAVLGGVLGSQLAGNGARTEGSALGAVLGGAAGYGIADKRVDCDNVTRRNYEAGHYRSTSYPTHSYPQPTTL